MSFSFLATIFYLSGFLLLLLGLVLSLLRSRSRSEPQASGGAKVSTDFGPFITSRRPWSSEKGLAYSFS
jgi:hypothetical protein